MYDNSKVDNNKIMKVLDKYASKVRFSPGVQNYITLKINKDSDKQILEDVKEYLMSNSVDENIEK